MNEQHQITLRSRNSTATAPLDSDQQTILRRFAQPTSEPKTSFNCSPWEKHQPIEQNSESSSLRRTLPSSVTQIFSPISLSPLRQLTLDSGLPHHHLKSRGYDLLLALLPQLIGKRSITFNIGFLLRSLFPLQHTFTESKWYHRRGA